MRSKSSRQTQSAHFKMWGSQNVADGPCGGENVVRNVTDDEALKIVEKLSLDNQHTLLAHLQNSFEIYMNNELRQGSSLFIHYADFLRRNRLLCK